MHKNGKRRYQKNHDGYQWSLQLKKKKRHQIQCKKPPFSLLGLQVIEIIQTSFSQNSIYCKNTGVLHKNQGQEYGEPSSHDEMGQEVLYPLSFLPLFLYSFLWLRITFPILWKSQMPIAPELNIPKTCRQRETSLA